MPPLNHNEAIAQVLVDGLGVCCFNSADTKWDLAFLRLPQPSCHDLILDVEGEELRHLDASVTKISFETVNGRFPDGFERGYFDNGPVDRHVLPNPGPETENFRWAIDLEDDHDVPHGFRGLKRPPANIGLTRAFIQNAVFYTLDVSEQELILVHDNENPNQMRDPPFLGLTNNEIAADIFCEDDGELIISINDHETFRKAARPGTPWKISLTNLCPYFPFPDVAFRKGDFQNFYHVIRVNGPHFALWGNPLEPVPGLALWNERLNVNSRKAPDFLVGRPDCDTTRLGTTETLDPLFN